MEVINQINEYVEQYSKETKIDANIIKAIITVESGWNPSAVRFEPRYMWLYKVGHLADFLGCTYDSMKMMQMCSWGLMQVMGSNFYELNGANEEKESNRWASCMVVPEMGIKYGVRHLQRLKYRYGNNPLDLYSAYNQGSPRKIDGVLLNATQYNEWITMTNQMDEMYRLPNDPQYDPSSVLVLDLERLILSPMYEEMPTKADKLRLIKNLVSERRSVARKKLIDRDASLRLKVNSVR